MKRKLILLEEPNEHGKIDEKLLKSIKSVVGQLPRHYGLAKVHKENIRVRPFFHCQDHHIINYGKNHRMVINYT